MEAKLQEFENYLKKMRALQMALTLFSWDMSTVAPRAGAPSRAPYIGLISAEQFEMLTSPVMEGYLDYVEGLGSDASEIWQAIARNLRREYDANKKIPPNLILEFSELMATAQPIWEKAKETNDYPLFAPTLEKIIGYQKRFIEARGYDGHPYNTLLDDYDQGMTVEKLDAFFSELKETVVPLLKSVVESKAQTDTSFLAPVDIATQQKLSAFLMDKVGFNSTYGILSESAHPFTTGFGKYDVRITTHYYEDKPLSSMYSVIHECGHAIYEQNISDELAGTPLENGANMSIHESQSGFYENIIGRSLPFWQNVAGEVGSILGGSYAGVSAERFYAASNTARPGMIRTEADELTYSLHIMVRYELEKEMISSDVDVSKLPGMWNDRYEEYLGIRPANDAEGILQDVHWSGGSFGYFPSYALGNAYASQIKAAMAKDLDFDALVSSGDIAGVENWLRAKIHGFGMLKTPEELIVGATGESLNAKYYTAYLKEKFEGIYGA